MITGAVNPRHKANWNKALWVVEGPDCFPTIFCAKLAPGVVDTEGKKKLIIWGYSVYRGKPGFRTLGDTLSHYLYFRKQNYGKSPVFFDKLIYAEWYVRNLVNPPMELKK